MRRLLLVLILLLGCNDGWYDNVREYGVPFVGAAGDDDDDTFNPFDDDDTAVDDDDTSVDDDDASPDDDDTSVDDDDTSVDDDDTSVDDDDTSIDDDDTSVDDDDTSIDDDDTSIDDDDTGDDDDTSIDDDDTSVDDDDTSIDDDDTSIDDDDTVSGVGIGLSVVTGTEDYGIVPINTAILRTVRVQNIGDQPVLGNVSLTPPAGAVWLLPDGDFFFSLFIGQFEDFDVQFQPDLPGPYTINFTATFEDSGTPMTETLVMMGEGYDGNSGEQVCDDEIDDDNDGLVDCDDPDCAVDAACGSTDFCCAQGAPDEYLNCWDQVATQCVCNIDPLCCNPASVGWDSLCAGYYINDCFATTCGP